MKHQSNLRAVFNLGRLDNLLLGGLLLGDSRGRGSLVIRIVKCGEKVGLKEIKIWDRLLSIYEWTSIRNRFINREGRECQHIHHHHATTYIPSNHTTCANICTLAANSPF
jgi:hypothetical protein